MAKLAQKAINNGVVTMMASDDEGREVWIRFYYDQAFVPSAGQVQTDAPLINGPRGYCMDVTNDSGRRVVVTVDSIFGLLDILVGKGDPVTAGAGRSRTLLEMQLSGYTTRASLGNTSIS